jgi:hypothetical protein
MTKTEDSLRLALESAATGISASSQQTLQTPASNSDIQSLLEQLATQIDDFDSTASETADTLKSYAAGTAWSEDAETLASSLDEYDYDQAEESLEQIKGKFGSEAGSQQINSIRISELVAELEILARQIDDHDAMSEEMLGGIIIQSSWMQSQQATGTLKRNLLGYDFAAASLQLGEILHAARQNVETDGDA